MPLAIWQLELLWFHWLSFFSLFLFASFCLNSIGWPTYQYSWHDQYRADRWVSDRLQNNYLFMDICCVWTLHTSRPVAPWFINANSAMTWISPSSSSKQPNQPVRCMQNDQGNRRTWKGLCEISKYNVKFNLTYSLILSILDGPFWPPVPPSLLLFSPCLVCFPFCPPSSSMSVAFFSLYLCCVAIWNKGGVSTMGFYI